MLRLRSDVAEREQVALVQRARDPQGHAARLQRLRHHVDVVEVEGQALRFVGVLLTLRDGALDEHTVLDAIQEGYEVYVPVDAVGGTSLAAHEAALRRMEQAGAKLISRVQMYCELQRDWARAVTVPGFMGVFENFDGFNAEKALEEAGNKA